MTRRNRDGSGQPRHGAQLGSDQGRSERRIATTWKWWLSGLLVLHLLAIVAEPFQFFTRSPRGTSPAADVIRNGLSPYVEFAYLNHGYFFFAPEPGPSHLLECKLKFEDGREAKLRFPDLDAQWPRLLYHRHFMLAEFLHQLHVPSPPTDASMDPQLFRDWKRDRQRFERIRDSMSEHLKQRYGAMKVEITRLEHRLPSSDEVLERGLPLDAPELYVPLPDEPVESFSPAPSNQPSPLTAPMFPLPGAGEAEEVGP